MRPASDNVWLHRFAVFTACWTFILIVAGGLVTSNEAGLSVPDWPLSYGSWMPPLVGNIRYEHGHRLVAAFVGLLTAGLAIWLWRSETRRWVRWLGLAALAAVVTQGVLGGLTVLFLLPPAVSIGHACLAQVFFCLTVTLALVTGGGWKHSSLPAADGARPPWSQICLLATVAAFVQLLLGAGVRHRLLGLAPHLAGAGALTLLALWILYRARARHRGQPALLRLAGMLAAVLLLQLTLGVGSYLVREATRGAAQPLPLTVWVTVAHVAFGALTLACCLLLTLDTGRLPATSGLSMGAIRDYAELTKPRVIWLILMSTAVGFYAAASGPLNALLLFHTLLGTALVAGGTAALNQWMERTSDAKMFRTQSRPLPAGRLRPARAFRFGLILSTAGVVYLAAAVNLLSGLVAAFTCLSYLLCYTPLKSRSRHATLAGAFPGATPILVGWTAARGAFTVEGWVLFGILFFWQFPHFLAIASLYREDYQRAGIRMLPVVDPTGPGTRRQIIGCTAALLLISAIPTVLGLAGQIYLWGALALGLAFLYFGVQAAIGRTKMQARRLLQASVFYLPLVYCLLVLDKQ